MKKQIKVGEIYNRWTVVKLLPNPNVLCRCSCGVEKRVDMYSILSGKSASCGCFKNEVQIKRLTTHGCTSNTGKSTRLYRIWGQMKTRCSNPKHQYWYMYGAVGITVCPEWHDFIKFKLWAEQAGYIDNLTIDRRDSTKSYYPSNCRWVTPTIQCRNRGVFNNNTSGFTGVIFNKVTSTWNVSITVNKKTIRIGTCATPENGARLRNEYIKTNNLKGYKCADI